jgi:hypothetical protein
MEILPDTVVVVPARVAWKEYDACHAYVCQPKRPFQEVKYLAFYSGGEIKTTVPLIREIIDEVVWKPSLHTGRLAETIRLLSRSPRKVDLTYKVFLLSRPEDAETIHLANPVINDLSYAFRHQRYVTLQNLRSARHTSDLVFLKRMATD